MSSSTTSDTPKPEAPSSGLKISSSSIAITHAFLGSPIITSEKLYSKNFLAWLALVEVWFLGEGLSDHLTKSISDIPKEDRSRWERFDYQLCALLWQLMEPTILVNLRSFKTCFTI